MIHFLPQLQNLLTLFVDLGVHFVDSIERHSLSQGLFDFFVKPLVVLLDLLVNVTDESSREARIDKYEDDSGQYSVEATHF